MGTNIPPDFWVALMDVLKAAATLSAAAFVSWAAVKLKDVRAGLHRVEHQVKNHHQTNLRDDIDRNQAATAKGIADVITQLAEIRKEQEKTAAMLNLGLSEHADMRKDIGGIRDEMRHARELADAVDVRVRSLEARRG